ncbi:hypothetical protein VVD49_19090 [Uliginosibacterium sp. H3]|uniref:Exopolysaccharide biosynthesis operon protein EpsL n=1 Tax=Uliginosibacterium silvisoli TaxID=3114758 RepID=A0ABU6K8B6_9RHOO|nr:hypothetical protein [Uliginosibacterium sp. H3]
MTEDLRLPHRHLRTINIFLFFAGIAPWIASAEEPALNPVRPDEVLGVSVSESAKYDSNVFRLANESYTAATSEAGQRHDFVSITTLRAALDKRFGRHRLIIFAAPSIVRYQTFDQFDYIGQQFVTDWSGRIGNDGRYGASYSHTKSATDPADQQVATGNTATRDMLGADLALPFAPRWLAVTAWRADKIRNSSETERTGDNDGGWIDGGIRFQPASGNKIDLRYRRSHYNYPNIIPSVVSDNTYTQNEVELSTVWQLSEPSRLEGRVSYVQREHENIPERDFSGWVGSVGYIWTPTEATRLALRVFRDLGAVSDASASYADTYGISLVPNWALSPKLALGGIAESRRRSYNGFTLTPRAPERTDRIGVTVRYMATRNWEFGFSMSDERRRTSDTARQYSDVISSLSAQWKM